MAEHDPVPCLALGEAVQLVRQAEQVGQRRLVAQHAIHGAGVFLAQRRTAHFERLLDRRRVSHLEADAHVHDGLLDLHALDEAHARRLHLEVGSIDVAQHADRMREALLVPRQDVQALAGGRKQELVARRHQLPGLRGEAELEAGVLAAQQLLDR